MKYHEIFFAIDLDYFRPIKSDTKQCSNALFCYQKTIQRAGY